MPSGILEPVNRTDVRMIQRREHLRFALEPRQAIRIAGKCRRQDLDRDVAIQLRIARAVDLAHPADAEQAVDAEHADRRCRSAARRAGPMSTDSPSPHDRAPRHPGLTARGTRPRRAVPHRRGTTMPAPSPGRTPASSTPRRRCATPRASDQESWMRVIMRHDPPFPVGHTGDGSPLRIERRGRSGGVGPLACSVRRRPRAAGLDPES